MKNIGEPASDSTMLYRSDSTIIIRIGNHLRPNPSSSQFVRKDGVTYYVMLDENSLHWFDVRTGEYVRLQQLDGCDILNNYSGFLSHNDTFFVYNYKQKKVYMLDSIGRIQKDWVVADSKTNQNLRFDPEALTLSPITYCQGQILLSGTMMGQPIADAKQQPISCNINLSSSEITYGGSFPKLYMDGDFGGVYFNTIYHTCNKKEWLYSFSADHNIVSYSLDFVSKVSTYMGSRYISEINSSDYNALELFKNKDLRIKYYISQPSYGNILYDKYRDVYYRIAKMPLKKCSLNGFRKPFSIIVMDREGNLITETSILSDYDKLDLYNMHVVKDGLLIKKDTDNENEIEFIIFKLNRDESF